VHAPQRVVRERERVERIVVPAEQRQRTAAAPRGLELLLACRVPSKMIEESQRLVRVLGGARMLISGISLRASIGTPRSSRSGMYYGSARYRETSVFRYPSPFRYPGKRPCFENRMRF